MARFSEKKVIEHKMYVLILSTTFVSFEEKFSDILSQTYKGLHVQYPLFLSDFNEALIFSTDFLKKIYQIS
jgi:hypothetical protein